MLIPRKGSFFFFIWNCFDLEIVQFAISKWSMYFDAVFMPRVTSLQRDWIWCKLKVKPYKMDLMSECMRWVEYVKDKWRDNVWLSVRHYHFEICLRFNLYLAIRLKIFLTKLMTNPRRTLFNGCVKLYQFFMMQLHHFFLSVPITISPRCLWLHMHRVAKREKKMKKKMMSDEHIFIPAHPNHQI